VKLYLSTIGDYRRHYAREVHQEWDDHRPITELDRQTLRRHYRRLRKSGINATGSRWIIWDLVDAGRRASRPGGFS